MLSERVRNFLFKGRRTGRINQRILDNWADEIFKLEAKPYHMYCLKVDEKVAKLEAEKEQMNEYIEEFHDEDYVLWRREKNEAV